MSFEEDLSKLEEIVRELERSDIDLERALLLFEQGIVHLRGAGGALQRVEARVQQLVEAANGAVAVVEIRS